MKHNHRRRTKPRILMRFEKGALVPDNEFSVAWLRARGYRIGHLVSVEMSRVVDEEHAAQFRCAHAFGTLCVENIEAFHNLDSHEALKKIQRDGNIECDVTLVVLDGGIEAEARVARSIAYELMEPGAFMALYKRMSEHVRERYWPDLELWRMDDMAKLMRDAA